MGNESNTIFFIWLYVVLLSVAEVTQQIFSFFLIASDLESESELSSVKWSNPGHILKAQGKFAFSFACTLFLHIFDT